MNFYSLIIPAHNEEKYLGKILDELILLDYPKNKLEIIVVENGSTDNTLKIAKSFTSKGIKIFSIKERGVSKARNFGASKSDKKCNWLVFLDADTILKKNFLRHLDEFLRKDTESKYSVGTSKILPQDKSRKAIYWFKLYNQGYKFLKKSQCIQIIRKDLFGKVKYDEGLRFAEDQEIIKELSKFGKFFFLETDQVFTSTRRFEKVGWVKLFLQWQYETVLPKKMKRKKDYRVVR